jgi:5-methylcytosine-specific restriction protein B
VSINKYPAQSAIEFIDGILVNQIPAIQRIDGTGRSKVHLFELGKGGKQFAVIVGDISKDTGKFGAQQTRILLETQPVELPDVMALEPSDFYNGSRIANQSDSRLAAPKQCSVMVSSETGVRRLLEWYANAPASTESIVAPHINKIAAHQNKEESEMKPEATNTILYGPPGTGKTFATAERAVMLCDGQLPATRKELMSRYEVLRAEQRINFVTFHQSFGYEEFVEGLRPHLSLGNQVAYSVLPGVFRRACDAARVRERVKPGLTGKPLKQRTIWKMSLGASWSDEGVTVFKYALENECVLLGYGDEVDFTGCDDEASIKAKLLEEAPETKKSDSHVRPVNLLKNEIVDGDIIVVSNGNKSFRGIAEVTGEYEFVDDAPFHQVRSVKWLAVFEPAMPVGEIFHKGFSMQTLYKLSAGGLNFDKLDELLSAEVDVPVIQPHVLIIDEINRANISKVFGELITLLEPDKREGAENSICVKLPYSGDDFSVPANLHVIGTMNTADRSIALLDTALRRRFDFEELEPNPSVLSVVDVPDIDMVQLLAALNRRVEALFDRDHRIGHAFFMGVKDLDGLEKVFRRKVIPLLQEYFYENWSNVRRALNDYGDGNFVVREKLSQLPADGEESMTDEPRWVYRVNDAPFPVAAYQRIYGGN